MKLLPLASLPVSFSKAKRVFIKSPDLCKGVKREARVPQKPFKVGILNQDREIVDLGR